MAIIDVHGMCFCLEIQGIPDFTEIFATIAHNVRQQLLTLPPSTLAQLHRACLESQSGNCADLLKLGDLAERAAGLVGDHPLRITAKVIIPDH